MWWTVGGVLLLLGAGGMPDFSGLELMREGKKEKPDIRWIIVTAFGSMEMIFPGQGRKGGLYPH